MTFYRLKISTFFTVLFCGFALLSGGLVPTAHAANTDPVLPLASDADEPFPTCDERVFLARPHSDPVEGDLVTLDLSSDPLTLVPIGPRVPELNYNAMAYNPADDFLYAIKQNSDDRTDLLRIGADGQPKFVAALDGIGTAIVGEFGPDGYYYIADQQRYIYKYDLSGPVPVLVGSDRLSRIIQDFGFYDGYLWTVATQDIGGGQTRYWVMKIDFSGTTVVETFGPERTHNGSVSFTSVFAAKNGIYAYNTTGGEFVKLNMPSDDINEMDFVFLASGETLSGSDGAKCPLSPLGLPAEIVVTKTSTTTDFTPGNDISFTITVENQGPWGATGILLEDPLPAGVTGASWTCTPSGAATCSPASGTGAISSVLDLTQANTSVTIELTMQTDPAASTDIVNTATIQVPEDFADDPSNNTSTSSLLLPKIELEKTGSWVDANDDGAPSVGETIEFTFSVHNGTTLDLTDVTIVDPMVAETTPASVPLLPSGESTEFTAVYSITAADIQNEMVVNTAFAATGTNGMHSEDATVEVPLPPAVPDLHTEKSARFLDDLVPNDLPDVGERLEFQVTVRNQGNVTMTVLQPVDEGPTFNGQKMTGNLSAFTPEQHVIPRNEERVFTAYYYLTQEDISMSAGLLNGVQNTVVTPALTPQEIEAGLPPTEYPLPVPAVATLPGYSIDKNAQVGQVMRGQQVPYVINLKPHEVSGMATLVDQPPRGFVLLPGSVRVDGKPYEPTIDGTTLSFDLEILDEMRIEYVLVATGAVSLGTHENTAQIFQLGQLAKPISVIARDEVEVIPDPIMDCGDVIGRVFDDRNRNGYQDDNEPGLPGARVATVEGMLLTTDAHGRFNVACADLPDGRIGSTYLMKLDPRSLPTGYRIISENPRSVRLTAGKISRLNFATTIGRVVRLDVNDAAFLAGQAALQPEWQTELVKLVETLETEPSVLRLSYIDGTTDRSLAGQRLAQLRSMISRMWKERPNRYRLEIEARLITTPDVATTTGQ